VRTYYLLSGLTIDDYGRFAEVHKVPTWHNRCEYIEGAAQRLADQLRAIEALDRRHYVGQVGALTSMRGEQPQLAATF
jgi:hypothetical protein